jgi:CRP-like cAMP-binding protein
MANSYPRNRLLAALPPQLQKRMLRKLKPVSLKAGDEIYGQDQPIQNIYFPAAESCHWSRRQEATLHFLSQMLGVRRAGVSVAAADLQKDKLIAYRRGTVTVVDRKDWKRRPVITMALSKQNMA